MITAENTTEGREKVDAMLHYLTLKYDARLAKYEGIKSDAPMQENGYSDTKWNPTQRCVFSLSYAATRLRALRGAIDYLNETPPQYISHSELLELLQSERAQLIEFGVRFRASAEMMEEIIDYVIKYKKI